MKKVLFICLGLLGLFGNSGTANAVTLVSGKLEHSGGEWIQYNKGYLYDNLKYTTGVDKISIASFSQLASIVSGANKPTSVVLNWMHSNIVRGNATLTSANLELYSGNTLLLSANLGSNAGNISFVNALGVAGNFDLTSNFNVTGGSLFTAGLVNGTIFASFNGNVGTIANSKDFHFTDIGFNVYYSGSTPPPAQVPEPASSVLLLSSLAGIAARRKKARGIEA